MVNRFTTMKHFQCSEQYEWNGSKKKKINQKVLKMQLISNRKKILLWWKKKKLKISEKKLQLLQTQKLNKKKSTMPTRIFFLLCRKKCVICTDREECEKKKWRFLFVASRHEKRKLKRWKKNEKKDYMQIKTNLF